jgi:EAL domain-containing protein (putative c-di-GMP-specific phosphodiesterase class I)/CHASE2 domain-containing sensor protein
MRTGVSTTKPMRPEPKPWKLLLWTAVAGLIFGLVGFGEVAEDWLRIARNRLHWHNASGDIVLVKIDDQSLHDIGRWPWPRRNYVKITDELTRAGAKRIFFDIMFDGQSERTDDVLLAQALKRSGRAYIAVRTRSGPNANSNTDRDSFPLFAQYARLGDISLNYNYENAVWQVPFSLTAGHQIIPSFASLLSGVKGGPGELFMPDYSIDPSSIQTLSASSLESGRFGAQLFKGKDVVVGTDSEAVGDQYFVPGTGKMAGAYVQIIGAETLKSGKPVDLGWVPLFVLALGSVALALRQSRPARQSLLLGSGLLTLLFLPAPLEARLIYLDITPGLFVILVVGTVLFWRRFRARGLVNPVSNLPNLNALRVNRVGRDQALIAARLLNYEEIVATLPAEGERQLIEQVVSRLLVGAPQRVLYQGDGGIFAWFEDPSAPFANHLDALYSMFRNPARAGKLSVDLSIAFGVEVGSGRSLASRLASALVAADEAAHDGLKWKYHDPDSLQDASWRLSMLSQLDEAIDRGEVWVAYQPKLDIATSRIAGAEALARWSHPEKGPIAASEFVAAAEQHNRIGKLTDFVLEKAVGAAVQINKRGVDFEIAVNLSARSLSDKGFTLRLSALLARHGLSPRNLTLELTETAALAGSGEGLDMITRLRDFGINIAIDDYGTGLSTLDYLKKIPANEIKIDQSFVRGIADNRSDRLMVQSTISLAHSLGRRVVAEGVEQKDVLDLLIEMECDVAQGFAIGRPMSLDALSKRIASERKRSAA